MSEIDRLRAELALMERQREMSEALSADDVEQIARKHGDRYLLPRLRTVDHRGAWNACEKLVEKGRARWIDYSSTLHPGIELIPSWRRHGGFNDGRIYRHAHGKY